MKIIKIFQNDNNIIELSDDDNQSISEYSLQLKDIMKSKDIMILETSSSVLLSRPHKINSILVSEVNNIENDDFIEEK